MARKMTPEQAKEYAEKKRARVKGLIDNALDALTDPATWTQFLSRPAGYSRYSLRNQLLIFQQDPAATDVAGYVDWQRRGRQVRKGETGILICAPIPWKKDDGDGGQDDGRQPGEISSADLRSNLRGVRATPVFDIAQTDPIDGAEFTAAEGSPAASFTEIRALVNEIATDEQREKILAAMDQATSGKAA